MGTLYCDTGGSATNSGSTDTNGSTLNGTSCSAAAAVLTLDAGTVLTSVVTTPGPTQSSIYVTGATNTNRKIFWISAVAGSGGATPTVTVDVSVTGTLSTWWIGGRVILTNAAQEGALRAGDTFIFNNSPAAQAASSWVFRNDGDSTSGFCTLKGKTGVRPVLSTSNSAAVTVNVNASSYCWVENLELKQVHASNGIAYQGNGVQSVLYNVKISDAGTTGVNAVRTMIGCEITGCGTDGYAPNTGVNLVYGCYIHDNAQHGMNMTTACSVALVNCIIESNTGKGVFLGATFAAGNAFMIALISNTIYANGDSGLEVTDADVALTLINNIFVNNGDAAGEYNVEWTAGTAELQSFHGWNNFFSALGGGSANLLNLTVNAQVAASEITTDPAMVNPASADFSILSTSGAFATGFPGQFLGSNLGRKNMGALQNNSAAAGGGGGSVLGGGVVA